MTTVTPPPPNLPPIAPRTWAPRIPYLIALALACVVVVVWSTASPPGSVPDEQFHAVSIWCANGDRAGICEPLDENAVLLPAQISGLTCHVAQMTTAATCANEPRPGLAAQPRAFINAESDSYPNGFYRVMNLLASGDATSSIIAMRIVNGLLAVALLFGILALGPPTIRQSLVVSWGVCLVPLGLFVVCSINPSSWTFTAAGLSWAAAYSAMQATRPRNAAILAALTAIALVMGVSSRVDGGALAAMGIIFGVALSPRGREIARRHRSKVTIAGGALLGVVALALLGTGQWALLTGAVGNQGNAALLLSNIVESPQLWVGALGSWGGIWGLGWLDVPLPAIVGVLGVMAYGAAALIGLAQSFRAKIVAVSIVAAAIAIAPVLFLQAQGLSVGNWVQPRYLLPGMLLLLGLAMTHRVSTGVIRLSNAQIAALAGAVTIAATFALHRLLRRYVTGIDVTSWRIDDPAEWWWASLPSPDVVWVVGSAAFGVLVVTGLLLTSRSAGAESRRR